MGHRHNRKRTRGGRRQHQHRSSISSLASTPSLRQPDPLLGLSLFMTDAMAGSSIWTFAGRTGGLESRSYTSPSSHRKASADQQMSSSLSSLASMGSSASLMAHGSQEFATARQFGGGEQQRWSDVYQNSVGGSMVNCPNTYAVNRDTDSMDKLEGSAERVIRFLFDGGMDYE